MARVEELLGWEKRLSEIYRVNPFSVVSFERKRRRLERELTALEGELLYPSLEERVRVGRLWLERYGEQGQQYPSLWQSFFFCLVRFMLGEPHDEPGLLGSRLEQVWEQLEQLGRRAHVPEVRRLLGICARAYLATEALERMRGASLSLQRLKKHIWSACFGSDLLRLLVYDAVLQELNVLILGPTGSGKELVARGLMAAGAGAWQDDRTGVLRWQPNRTEALNLAEFPRDLMAAQIVGYKKGSFTGAVQDFRGVLARCDEGVVFLDEVAELPTEGQVVLLRALETRRVRPLGAEGVEAADCRVIAATHRELANVELAPQFRRDLFYRLAGAVIRVPPLAQRREDLLPIALGFLREWGVQEQASLHLEDPRHRITQWLQREEVAAYEWPGNVRELKRAVAQLLVGRDEEELHHTTSLPAWSQESGATRSGATRSGQEGGWDDAYGAPEAIEGPGLARGPLPLELVEGLWPLEEVKGWYIKYILDKCEGNQKTAAQRLKIHRTTIYHLLKKEKKQ